MKKVLKKSPYRQNLFRETTGLKLPPNPIITHWNTWLETAFYYLENFKKVESFVEELDPDSKSAKTVKLLIKSQTLQNDLLKIHEFEFLTEIIRKLQKSNLKLEEQLDLLGEAKTRLSSFTKEKLENSLSINPDLLSISEISDITQRLNNKYAPLVSVDVEQSFSQYKIILNDRRQRLSAENLIMINCIQYNAFLKIQ